MAESDTLCQPRLHFAVLVSLRSIEKQAGSVGTPKPSCSLDTLYASRHPEILVLSQFPQKGHAMIGSQLSRCE
jgi:hypothetical protein